MMKLAVLFVVAVALAAPLLAVPDHPRWAIHVSSFDVGGLFFDKPNCHPLEYFSNHPTRLNDRRVLVPIQRGRNKDESQTLIIGEVGGRAIDQVTHKMKMNEGELFLKLIVVEREPGEFCEIYHQEWTVDGTYREVYPVALVGNGAETILLTRDPVEGNGNQFDEHYWTFDDRGPIDLHVTETIGKILSKLLPEGSGINKGGGFDVENLTYTAEAWGSRDGQCCPIIGTIHIQFALKDHRLIVVNQSFDPE